MADLMSDLLTFCHAHKSLLFYGAGTYAWNLYAILSKRGVKIDACVTTVGGKDNNLFMDHIPIYNFNMFPTEAGNRYGIILALQSRYHEEVITHISNRSDMQADIFTISDSGMNELALIRRVDARNEQLEQKVVLSKKRIGQFHKHIQEIMNKYRNVVLQFIDMRYIGTYLSWIYYCRQRDRGRRCEVYDLLYPVVLFEHMELKGPNTYLTEKMSTEGITVACLANIDFWRYFYQTQRNFFVLDDNACERNQWVVKFNRFVLKDTLSDGHRAYISFTDKEKAQGQSVMEQINLSNDFVCFSVRDNKYRTEVMKFKTDVQDMSSRFRNAPVSNYRMAMENLGKNELQAVRMGAMAESRIDWKNTIDYASDHRSEFMDVFLFSKCKFFVCTPSGIQALAQLFSKPLVSTDATILSQRTDYELFLSRERDLVIFKKYWWKAKNRYLTFREMLERETNDEIHELCSIGTYTTYERDGIIPVDNTPEEIDDVVQEMLGRLNGTMAYDKEDEILQQRFFDLIDTFPLKNNFPFMWRVGAKFLKQNSWLLD